MGVPHIHAQWLASGTAGVRMAESPAMSAVKEYLSRPTVGWIWILASRHRGSGKSLAAAWLLERLDELVETRRDVHAVKSRAWTTPATWCDCASLDDLKRLKPWERAAEIVRLSGCWALVLDDVGTESDHEVVKKIVADRYGSQLITILTTNLVDNLGQPEDQWKLRLDARITSRLRSSHDDGNIDAWRWVPGPDMRGKVEPEIVTDCEQETKTYDIDSIVAPLLQSTSPQRRVEEAKAVREESIDLADVARRKLWGSVALSVLADAAEGEEPWALDALDEIKRRVR